MKDAIIWGTGSLGEISYYKLIREFRVIGFADSNIDKWGTEFLGKKIYSFDELKDKKDYILVIASTYYNEIVKNIQEIGLDVSIYYISPKSFLLEVYEDDQLNKVKETKIEQKVNKLKKVLFVQDTQCIRTLKIAKTLFNNGIEVDLAYMYKHPEILTKKELLPYTNIIPINNIKSLIEYVNSADYDIVHCSNEPDYLTNLMIFNTNKAVVHDNHDLMSLRADIDMNRIVLEFNANRFADGNMYVTEKVKNIAIEKFDIEDKEIMVLNNYIEHNLESNKCLHKLSDVDKEIHCVYEGGISDDPEHHRYFEKIFLDIAKEKIHVHFYAMGNNLEYYKKIESLSDYIHYEGCCGIDELMVQLTQYDIGLVQLNITPRNSKFLQTTFPNKIFEYLSAGLPVAVCNIQSLKDFVDNYNVGKELLFDCDIKKQLEEIRTLEIEKDFLEKNKLTMDSQADNIINFYEKVMRKHNIKY